MMRPLSSDPSSYHSAARTRLPFSFVLLVSSFCLESSLLPFSVSPFRFVLSFSVSFLYRLLRFSFRFSALLGGGCCVLSCVLAFLLLIYSGVFCLSSLPSLLSVLILDVVVVCSILFFFLCGYDTASSVSVPAGTDRIYRPTCHQHVVTISGDPEAFFRFFT